MTKITAKEWRAIKAYAEANELRPQLSVPSIGQYTFLDRDDKIVNVGILTMREWYELDMKAQKEGV